MQDTQPAPHERTKECRFCESTIPASARKCRHCGEWLARPCEGCGTPLAGDWAARGVCVECMRQRTALQAQQDAPVAKPLGRSRGVAMVLAAFAGTFGLHRFYLGRKLSGFMYLLFFWTGIPALLGIVEAVRLGLMSSWTFSEKYD
jgi:TM2 domain-containing membrane protein YozV